MSDDLRPNLLADTEVQRKVQEIWDKVFESSAQVIHHAKAYGFEYMAVIPSPNIHQMLVRLQMVSSILDILITNSQVVNIDYDSVRMMLNAKEQFTRLERLAAALQANDRNGFEEALNQIETQAHF